MTARTWTFNRFEISMTLEQAQGAAHSGDCDADVDALLPAMRAQLAGIPDDDLAAELREYGAWDEDELHDRAFNETRIVWIAAGEIASESETLE